MYVSHLLTAPLTGLTVSFFGHLFFLFQADRPLLDSACPLPPPGPGFLSRAGCGPRAGQACWTGRLSKPTRKLRKNSPRPAAITAALMEFTASRSFRPVFFRRKAFSSSLVEWRWARILQVHLSPVCTVLSFPSVKTFNGSIAPANR